MQEGSVLMLCPSFSSYSSIRFAEIADKVSHEFFCDKQDFGLESPPIPIPTPTPIRQNQSTLPEQNQKHNNGFEFAVSCRNHESLTISADEIFSNGQIRPIFPIPSSPRRPLKQLLSEDGDSMITSCSLPESDALAGTYCVWKPNEDEERCKKSSSTGTSKRWRLRDLISRSNSDGTEKIIFLARSNGTTCAKKKEEDKKVTGKLTTTTRRGSGDGVKSAVEIHYMRNRALKEEDRRRTFLPYRRDIVGFFANVNGLSRNLHPF